MVTMATRLFTVGSSGNHGNQVGLDCVCTTAIMVNMVTKLFTLGQKWLKRVAGFSYKGSMDVF
jgi:hypothetical protein